MNPGDRLAGRYTLDAKIGGGGMGELWRGTQDALGRTVAIKLIAQKPEDDDAEMRERFKREAELAAKVEHRNVVDIIDYGTTDDGTQFLVMPLLKGRSLHERLRTDPPPSLAELVRWVRALLSGLAAIHDHGIIHRDLKPANVFLATDAEGVQPKLLDFGISRAGAADASLTGLGTAMGTPQYMAPEQFESARDVDLRADLYGVGAILYLGVTGHPPFDGVDAFAVFRAVLETRPAEVSELRPAAPEPLATLVHRAIAKAPEDRFASAREMRDALDALDLDTLDALPARGGPTELGSAKTTPAERRVAPTANMGEMKTVAADVAADQPSVPRTANMGAVASTSVQPSIEPPAPAASAEGRSPVYVVLALLVFAAVGAGAWWVTRPPTIDADPVAEPTTFEGPMGQGLEGPSGFAISESGPLAELALRWGRLPPAERPDDVRLVGEGDSWQAVVPGETDQAVAERLAGAFESTVQSADWDPEAGLTPQLAQVTVRLNVHTEASVDAPTSRVLAHDTLVVALTGEHEGTPSRLEGDRDTLAYFVVSASHAGWAVARYLETAPGCMPPASALVRDASLSPAAVRADLSVARTHATYLGQRAPLWLFVARDHTSLRSAIGLYEMGDEDCGLGELSRVVELDGVLDEVFFTETRPDGETLLVTSTAATEPPPEDGRMTWQVRGPDGVVWTELLPTAAYLPRGRRGAVSGRRDRLFRRDEEHALAVRPPREARNFYFWREGTLVLDAPEEVAPDETDETAETDEVDAPTEPDAPPAQD